MDSSTISNKPDAVQEPSVTRTNERAVLDELSNEMLRSTGDYISSEIETCIADYVTLEKMNRAVADKYANLAVVSSNISGEMAQLNETYATLMPMLGQIDDLEMCIGQLEQSTNKIDEYSKRLEQKYRQVQEKYSTK